MVRERFAPGILILAAALISACGGELFAPDGKTLEDEGGPLIDTLPVDGLNPDGTPADPGDGDGDGTDPGDGDGDGSAPTPDDGDGDGDGDDPPPDNPLPPSPYPPPPNEGDQCNQWQDCGPYGGDQNSGFECVNNACTCDPGGHWSETCQSGGGYWVYTDCLCVFADAAPPDEYAGDGCYWHYEQPVCDPDRWVDTSHYEDECYYDANDEWRCDPVWVESGYYEAGACPSPYWDRRC